MQDYIDIFIDNFIKGIPNLVTAFGIFIVGVYLAKALSKVLTRVLKVRKAPEGVTQLLAQLAYSVVIVFGVIAALQRFFDVTAFLAGLGILGFTVGFALQDVMKNFAAGVILLIQQPFHIGEAIGVKDYDGTVLEIDLRSTEIRAVDGRIVIIPNADILANPIVNYTRATHRRVDLSLNLPLGTDPTAARQIVLDIIQNIAGFMKEPAPMVAFENLTSSTLGLSANFWIDVSKTNPVEAKDGALLQIRSMFKQQGIEIPHPIQSVYVRSESL
jgi:small-conductance mechanosensitive channel